MTRFCRNCGDVLKSLGKRTVFCDDTCAREETRRKYRQLNKRSDLELPTSTVGTIAELQVGIDLLRRGYAVFRALSSSCPCDLAILKDGKLLRVEVKTGYNKIGGGIVCPKVDRSKFDILAAVVGGEIKYDGLLLP